MSPDDIIAANLWPWPDPLLKRDQAGNIIFVNAAFLQLYGGRVEDWSARSVGGWPAPTLQGAQRFETRSGQAPNETIYDWVEMVMADGNAMAIARNVTAMLAKPTPPADIAPVLALPKETAPTIGAPPPALNMPLETPAAPQSEPVMQAPEPIVEPVVQSPSLTVEFESTLNNNADDYSYEEDKPAAAPAPEPVPAPQEAVIEPEQETPRMIERRALPIEDSASVLGSNWRDQVIAKALGDESTPETSQDATTEKTPDTGTGPDDTKETPKVGDGLNILLAEDNAINALLTRTLLEAEGASVDTVEDGKLAVEAVQNNTYDMIFMDMRMPNMDGLESTRKIRALGAKMPIVALTANAFDDDRNSCFDSGMNDFMTKPVSAEELTEMVVTWTKESEDKKLAS